MKDLSTMSQEEFMKASKVLRCINCEGQIFRQVVTIRTLSKLYTGKPQDDIVPIPLFRCDDCGTPVEKMMPSEA